MLPNQDPDIVSYLARSIQHQPNTGCWNWVGKRDKKGYGITRYSSINNGERNLYFKNAYWLLYYLYKGYIPVDMAVCHHCDNPPCCNPEHLFLGTALDNTLDSVSKGRSGYYRYAQGEHSVLPPYCDMNYSMFGLDADY